MTLARHLLNGETYLITRRAEGRTFLLRPDQEIREAYFYLLAFAARTSKIDIHLAQLMSNHKHVIASAPNGGVPRFTETVHFQMHRVVHKIRQRTGKVWDSRQTSLVKLLDKNAIIDKALYVEMNPVRAGMVKNESKWPGLIRERVTVWKKPSFLTNPNMRDEEVLALKEPPGFESWEEWMDTLDALRGDARKQARQERIEDARAQNKVAFLGAKRALKIAPEFQPDTPDGYGERNPRFASRCRATIENAYEAEREWRREYENALARLRKDGRAEFPEGTWKMAITLGQLALF